MVEKNSDKNVLISVIVPVYNAEKYLERCIESILCQKTNEEYEVILINDGSTDNSLQICRRYEQKDKRIKIINQENKGVAVARNQGISVASGQFVVFIDSDDYVKPNFITECSKNKNEKLIVFGHITRNREKELCNIYNLKGVVTDFFDSVEGYLSMGIFSTVWAKRFRTDIIKENNLLFSQGLCIGEDRLFNLKYLKKVDNIYFSDECIYVYCLRENSASHFFYKNHIAAYEEILSIQHSLFNKNIIEKEEIKSIDYFLLKKILHDAYKLPDINGKIRLLKRYSDTKKLVKIPEFNVCIRYKMTEGSLDERIEAFCLLYNIYFLNNKLQVILDVLKRHI